MKSPVYIWHKCLEQIRNQVNKDLFNVWFTPIIPLRLENNNNFIIQVPNQFFYEYLDKNYAEIILQSLSKIIGNSVQLNYQIKITKHKKIQDKWDSNTNKKQTFDNFFKSDCNKIIHGISEKIINEPGKIFNPCFFYGETGVGKTHLCHAIGNKIEKNHIQKKVLYVSAPSFQIQFTDSILNKRQNDFIRFYQQVDILILDDIQEFSNKEKTLQAYFHLFNHLRHLGKQLILTADKAPIEIEGLEERLVSRFKWGLVIEMNSPDKELRRKIVQHQAKQNKLELSKEIIEYIVDNVNQNARDLEGITNSLAVYSLFNQSKIDMHLVQKIIYEIVRSKSKQITLEKVQKTVSSYFKIDIKQILSKSRMQEVVQARHVSMFLSKKYTNSSYGYIGTHTGHRDHATVLHACNSIQNKINTNKWLQSTVKAVEALLI